MTAGTTSVSAAESLEMLDLEVRDADRAGAPVPGELLERSPGRDVPVRVLTRARPVDEEQVDVVEAQGLERAREAPAGIVGTVVPVVQLGRHEHLVAGEARGGDRLADAGLVAVHLRRVHVPVADLQRLGHEASRLARGSRKTPSPSCGIVLPSFSRIAGPPQPSVDARATASSASATSATGRRVSSTAVAPGRNSGSTVSTSSTTSARSASDFP